MKHNQRKSERNNKLSVINFFQMCIEKFYGELPQYQQLSVNAENEHQAMSCGAFNPQFLAMIKRSKVENNR